MVPGKARCELYSSLLFCSTVDKINFRVLSLKRRNTCWVKILMLNKGKKMCQLNLLSFLIFFVRSSILDIQFKYNISILIDSQNFVLFRYSIFGKPQFIYHLKRFANGTCHLNSLTKLYMTLSRADLFSLIRSVIKVYHKVWFEERKQFLVYPISYM